MCLLPPYIALHDFKLQLQLFLCSYSHFRHINLEDITDVVSLSEQYDIARIGMVSLYRFGCPA